MPGNTERTMRRSELPLFFMLMQISMIALADPSAARSITHLRSPCVVERSSGEYPLYVVKRSGLTLYAPKSDGITKAIFSPNGRYIAFSGSEISGVDIKAGDFTYSVVVLECQTGLLQGFKRGIPESDLTWRSSTGLRFTDAVTGKQVDLNL